MTAQKIDAETKRHIEALRAKGISVQVPGQPMPHGTGSVTTPATPAAPSGHYWDRLKVASTPAQLAALREELERHGYSASGQIMKAVLEKASTAGAKKRSGR